MASPNWPKGIFILAVISIIVACVSGELSQQEGCLSLLPQSCFAMRFNGRQLIKGVILLLVPYQRKYYIIIYTIINFQDEIITCRNYLLCNLLLTLKHSLT